MEEFIYKDLKEYYVPDINLIDSDIVFILESPHTEEVKNGYPVAGKSGIDMSKVLLKENIPFGKIVSENKIKKLGILNVCNYPLQEVVYQNNQINKDIIFFSKIRQNPKYRKKDFELNIVLDKILNDFKKRLGKLKNKKIVLCGNFAETAFKECFKEEDFREVLKVPHPSFNNWHKEKYKKDIEKLLKFI